MNSRELRYALTWGAVVMGVTCLPYLAVWWLSPADGVFPGILFNSDDHGVYYSWMRQGHDGRLLFRNLFTTDPQRGVYFHLYFLVLGWVARLPALDIPLVYHLGRAACGVGVLALVYRLAAFFTADQFARRCAFWTVALSAGVGWLYWTDGQITQKEPVDVWQPEAVTFASLYSNGLFAVSLALMLGVVVCLLLAEERGWKWALAAGACGLVLGNVHSYDVIHLFAVWALYLLLRAAAARRLPARELGLALLAGAAAAPAVAYMAWLYQVEPIFRARADTATLSDHVRLYLLGYGLLLPLAAWGLRILFQKGAAADPRRLLLPAWCVAGLAVAYAPFAFQRKMIMGYHFPLALLAGLAVAELARRVSARSPAPRAAAAAAVIALLAVSNVRFMLRDVSGALRENRTSTFAHPTYWPQQTIHAFEWMGANSRRDAVLLAVPFTAVMAPAYSGRAVYAGHWGETPRFTDRVRETTRFFEGRWSSEERRRFLARHGITHVLYGPAERYLRQQLQAPAAAPPLDQEPFLRPAFTEGETTLFAVVP